MHQPPDTKMRRPPRPQVTTRRPAFHPSRPGLRAGRAGILHPPSADGLTQQIVEFAHLDAFDERGDFRSGVDKSRSFWIPRIPDSELTADQFGQLDAGPLRVAGAALSPSGTGELGGWHTVVRFHSSMTSSSIPLKISTVCSGDSPSTLRRSMTSVYFSTSSRLSR